MTSPDPANPGLDPAHILGVCVLATISRGDHRMLTLSTPAGVRIVVPTRQAAGDALAALTLTGYRAIPVPSGGRGRALLVTGWSPAGLDARLTAMRSVIGQLDADPTATASAVISRVRSTPASSPAAAADQDALGWARSRLRAFVAERSGIHAPHHPMIVPADQANALRLRAAWIVEGVIDDLIERQLRVARHALRLYGTLRQNTSDDQAQKTAVRQARDAFHISDPGGPGAPAQDTSAVIQRAGQRSGPSVAPSGPGPADRAKGGPAQTAASDIPRAATGSGPAAKPAAIHPPARADGPSPPPARAYRPDRPPPHRRR